MLFVQHKPCAAGLFELKALHNVLFEERENAFESLSLSDQDDCDDIAKMTRKKRSTLCNEHK